MFLDKIGNPQILQPCAGHLQQFQMRGKIFIARMMRPEQTVGTSVCSARNYNVLGSVKQTHGGFGSIRRLNPWNSKESGRVWLQKLGDIKP